MATSPIVTRGFGPDASIALITTAGYGSSDATALPDSMIGTTQLFLSTRTTDLHLSTRTTQGVFNTRTTEDA